MTSLPQGVNEYHDISLDVITDNKADMISMIQLAHHVYITTQRNPVLARV